MKNQWYLFVVLLLISSCSLKINTQDTDTQSSTSMKKVIPQKQLRHVVMFKFKESSTSEEIQIVEEAFAALPSKIAAISDFEWGTNNSPEGLDKGFTHVFFVSFNSEADREIYLPHPAHKAFVDVLSPHLEDVMVMDYWSE